MTDSAPILGRLLLLSSTTAAAAPYLRAARKLNVVTVLGINALATGEIAAAADRTLFASDALAEFLPLELDTRDSALAIAQFALQKPLVAIFAADERSAPSAARAASIIGLSGHAPQACDACLDAFGALQRLGNAGLPVPPLAGASLPAADVIALLAGRKMRVLGVRAGARETTLPRPALEDLFRAARLLLFRDGPLYARIKLSAPHQILAISPAIPTAFVEALRFRIPLVAEDLSLAEVLLRHALRLDVRRAHRQR
jgi:hypothetical protein